MNRLVLGKKRALAGPDLQKAGERSYVRSESISGTPGKFPPKRLPCSASGAQQGAPTSPKRIAEA